MLLPTLNELTEMLENYEAGENPGWCVSCGEQLDGLEPDARDVECDVCGARTGYGAAELLQEGLHN